MIIKCWGARGSIPVSGKEFLKYGGSTTCLEITTKGNEIIIIDAGSGIRKLGNKLLKEDRNRLNIVFTHSHWDHLIGFPFFKPLYNDGTTLNLFGCSHTQDSLQRMISPIMTQPNSPVGFENIRSNLSFHKNCEETFQIDSVTVTPIFLSHPGQGLGFKFIEDDKSFVFLTDNELTFIHPGGLSYQDYLAFTRDADLLFHDAEYTEEEYEYTKAWGHTIYTDALKLALEAGVKKLGLFHHDQDRIDSDLDKIVRHCEKLIDKSGENLECFGVSEEMEIVL